VLRFHGDVLEPRRFYIHPGGPGYRGDSAGPAPQVDPAADPGDDPDRGGSPCSR
jgi:hypothetical protein